MIQSMQHTEYPALYMLNTEQMAVIIYMLTLIITTFYLLMTKVIYLYYPQETFHILWSEKKKSEILAW